MNKEAPYRKRAEQTRKKINSNKEPTSKEGLPPRTEVHRKKQHKNKWKIKFPIIHLLVLFFILLPISIYSAYTYLNSGMNGKSVIPSAGYEKISLEQQEDKKHDDYAEGPANLAGNYNDNQDHSLKSDLPSKDVPDNLDGKGLTQSIQVEGSIGSKEVKNLNDLADQPETNNETEILYHTVKKGDNLFRISLKYYHSQEGMEIIREANNLSGDEIQLGQVLIIPINNE